MKQKVFALLVMIFIMVNLGIIGYLGYRTFGNPRELAKKKGLTAPTSTPTLAPIWKTYTSNGVSFGYPADWKIGESSELLLRHQNARFYKEGDVWNMGIHFYFAPLALVEKEVVARTYSVNKSDLKEQTEIVAGQKMITIYISEKIPVYYHSIDYNGGSYIFIARGEDKEKIFRQDILPTIVFN